MALRTEAEKKVAVEKAKREKEALIAARWRELVFRPVLEEKDLRHRYSSVWFGELTNRLATKVLPGLLPRTDTRFRFFTAYFYCGLCPPFSGFFDEVMASYGLHFLDYTPNAVTTLSVFAHLCENFVGVMPNLPLFHHFYMPRVEKGHALSRSISFIPGSGMKAQYLEGDLHHRWDEWKAEWCWIE